MEIVSAILRIGAIIIEAASEPDPNKRAALIAKGIEREAEAIEAVKRFFGKTDAVLAASAKYLADKEAEARGESKPGTIAEAVSRVVPDGGSSER